MSFVDTVVHYLYYENMIRSCTVLLGNGQGEEGENRMKQRARRGGRDRLKRKYGADPSIGVINPYRR